jgi:hypothetical protein
VSISGDGYENPALEAEMDAMTATWRTRDGREVLISEMGDSHLLNTIRYLERNKEAIVLNHVIAMSRIGSTFGGDGAQDAYDNAMAELADEEHETALEMCVPEYKALVAEAERRKLVVQ